MTNAEFISIVKHPKLVNATHETDLKEMVELFPYFVSARLFFVKALQQSHSIHLAPNIKMAALYSSNRRWLYYYLHPEKMLSTKPYRGDRVGKSSGNYFDMMNVVENEGSDSLTSLKNLAERLKSARTMVESTPAQIPQMSASVNDLKILNTVQKVIVENSVLDKSSLNEEEEISENNAKQLIREKKYKRAIEILKRINLNNPKKSVYFVDQIRFLEKVIANSKK